MFKMESTTNELNVKQNTEFNNASRSDVNTLGQGVSNEGGHLLAKGQDMGPLPTKLGDRDSLNEIVYYGVSIPSDAVIESDGK